METTGGRSTIKEETGVSARADRPLADSVYRRLLGEIMAGTHPPGSRLPAEADLCRRFRASRPVIREALSRLRREDIVYSRKGSGSYVLAQPEPGTGLLPPVASVSDIRHCFEFRLSVEGDGAYHAATRAGAAELQAIATALEAFDRARPSGAPAIAEDFDFHLAVARASGNPFYLNAIQALVQQIRFGMNLSGSLARQRSEERLALIHCEHGRVFEAIRMRAPEAAREAMRRHVIDTWHRIFGAPDQRLG